ncbi:arsenate reductase (glutaredoxin) [Noviherbaspirillum sp. UKPF54]|uniref:arsenate reductase (glutaredoxin) n=1 Tax=Noviherbaspirillum sp. UKPF54 TaxID=2601898 RepID=UPI0011B18096|nr:arsenate reductase (glutaredoxin) [Noviherbaspirillum sp. UKPF54]QDZ30129.1 arsenate reductase (glutaredoxin) [Noviherbaspirillum sp. UKPF54]
MLTIFHNPRCSKSREGLALVEQFASKHGLPLTVVEYLKTPPDLARLQSLHQLLGGSVRDMVRTNEEEYDTLQLAQADDETLLSAIVAHPKLLQRPIIEFRGRAVIARPPELLTEFLRAD